MKCLASVLFLTVVAVTGRLTFHPSLKREWAVDDDKNWDYYDWTNTTATTTTTTTAPPGAVTTTTAPPGAVNAPRECDCAASGLWLDIVFVIDSSNGVNEQDFSALKALLIGFVMQMNIGQGTGQYTRVAIVSVSNVAHRISDLTTYNSNREVMGDLTALQFDGVTDFNLGAGLAEAWKIIGETDTRKNARNLVILFASDGATCSSRAASSAVNPANADDDPCRVAAQMVEDVNTDLMIVALKFSGGTAGTGFDFGSPCFYAVNDVNLMSNLIKYACKANCFCADPYTQFESTTEVCREFGECVYSEGIPSPYLSAQIGCQMIHATLTDVLSSDKDTFLKAIAVKQQQRPYWIGLQKTAGQYRWDSGFDLKPGDYTGWATGEPDASKGDCAFVNTTKGFNQAWFAGKCDWGTPSLYYFCQKKTCDTGNYCE